MVIRRSSSWRTPKNSMYSSRVIDSVMRCLSRFNEDWERSDKEEHAYVVFMGGHICNVCVCYNFEVGWKMIS